MIPGGAGCSRPGDRRDETFGGGCGWRANGECIPGTALPSDHDLTFHDSQGRQYLRGADREGLPGHAAVDALTDQPAVPADHDRALVNDDNAPQDRGDAAVHLHPCRAVVAADQSAGPDRVSQIRAHEGNTGEIGGHSGIHGRP